MSPIYGRKCTSHYIRVLVHRNLVVAILKGTRTVRSKSQRDESQDAIGHHRVNGITSCSLPKLLRPCISERGRPWGFYTPASLPSPARARYPRCEGDIPGHSTVLFFQAGGLCLSIQISKTSLWCFFSSFPRVFFHAIEMLLTKRQLPIFVPASKKKKLR